MEQEPIVLSEIFWGNILPRIIKHHQFRHDNQEPSKIQVVMIEEIGGIEVEYIPQVREVLVEEEHNCVWCGKYGTTEDPIVILATGESIHSTCKVNLEESTDDSNRPLRTGGHSEPDLPSSANSLGESEPERSE